MKFPDSLTTIEYRAFHDCKSLTKVVLPENLTDIGMDIWGTSTTFENCSSVYAVQIPKSLQKLLPLLLTAIFPMFTTQVRKKIGKRCPFIAIIVLF